MLAISTYIDAIPPLPTSVMQLNTLRENPDRSLKDIIAIVETDSMLSAKILGLINTPFYGMKKEITSIAAACVQLGEATIYSTALLIGIRNNFPFDLSAYDMSERNFIFNTLMQMNLMKEWTRSIQPQHASELQLAAFLSGIGKILLSHILIEEQKVDLFKKKIENDTPEWVAEIEVTGVSSLQVSTMMLRHWKVDSTIVAILEYTDSSESIPEDLQLPVAMMETVYHMWNNWDKSSEDIKHKALEGFSIYDETQRHVYENALHRTIKKLEEIRTVQ